MIYNAVELFVGAGGLALGLQRAGFACSHAYDRDPDAVETFKAAGLANVTGCVDLSEWSLSDWQAQVGISTTVDLLAGGPPCQPFSVSGKGAGSWDPRDGFPHFLRAVEALGPRAIMIENVKGLAGTKHRDYLMAVVAKLEALGYETRWRVLNASHYGVAQTRERIFVVAFRGRANFEWPGQLGPVATTRDALGVMPEALGTCSDGGKTKMPPHRPIRSLDQPCMTIRAQHKAGGTGVLVVGTTTMPNAERFLYSDGTTSPTRYPPRHPVTYSVRRLTTVEAAAIQGFPTGYPFFGTTTSRYRQIGNAVPPGLSEAVGRNIIKALTATAAPNPLLTRACIL